MENIYNDYSDRLEYIISNLKLTPLAFSRLLGYQRADKIYNVLNKKNKPSFDILADIINKFDNVNIEWLLTGSGNPFKNKTGQGYEFEKKDDTSNTNSSIVPRCITVDNDNRENIVMLDIRAAAGYPANIDNPQYLLEQPAFSIPRPEFQGSTFRGFQVSGDSMEPTITNSSWVFAIAVDEPEYIKDGLVYVVIKRDGVVVKRVLNRLKSRNQLVLKSDNSTYPISVINQEDILEVWAVKAMMSFDLGNRSADLYQMINSLEIKQLDNEDKINELVKIVNSIQKK